MEMVAKKQRRVRSAIPRFFQVGTRLVNAVVCTFVIRARSGLRYNPGVAPRASDAFG